MQLRKLIRMALIAACTLVAGCGEDRISFSQNVAPILEKNCLSCHKRGGEGYAASGFSVESYESVMEGTKLGPVIQPGYSYASTLQILIEHRANRLINMPKGRAPLSRVEIQMIGEWIDQGAENN